MSDILQAITPAYDLLKSMPAPADYEKVVQSLYPDHFLDDDKELDEKRQILRFKLKNADKAIEMLKTVPADEGREELTKVVEALIPMAAYALSDKNAQAQVAAQLQPLFQMFHDIYAEQYSDKALQKLVEAGMDVEKATKYQADRIALEKICADFNPAAMREFLLQLNAKQHPDLLNPMIENLQRYRRENMSNWARSWKNNSDGIQQLLVTKAQHSAYSQGWEWVGFMLGNCAYTGAEMLLHTAASPLGFKTPFAEDSVQAQNQILPSPDGKGTMQNPRMVVR